MSTVGRAAAVALWGMQGTPVFIEASVNNGLPGIDLVGLPDASVTESKKRVRAAIANLGIALSAQRITVNLSPGSVKKYGTAFDLGIAVAILAAEGRIPPESARTAVFCGELGLDARLHPVTGVLPTVLAAKTAGFTTVVVPAANATEAQLVNGVNVVAVADLAAVINACGGEARPLNLPAVEAKAHDHHTPPVAADLADVQGQDDARYALEVAAAGGHHMLMIGSPGAGKTLLAGCMPSILPPLTEDQAVETVSLRSIDGSFDPVRGLDRTPPFEAPHHKTTAAAMIGGAKPTSVGYFSKAHRGVLFMDEAPEFTRDVLEALRQPLENGRCEIGRAWGTVSFPAMFQLILAANPCPCGSAVGDGRNCRCSPVEKRRYRNRLSGPLLDRIDIQLDVLPLTAADLHGTETREPSRLVAARVAEARKRQYARFRKQPWSLNAQAPGSWLRKHLGLERTATRELDRALEHGVITMRGYDRIVRVAATIADLAGRDRPTAEDLSAALVLRSLEA